MDLHDFKDVAENYDRYLEVMYAGEDQSKPGKAVWTGRSS